MCVCIQGHTTHTQTQISNLSGNLIKYQERGDLVPQSEVPKSPLLVGKHMNRNIVTLIVISNIRLFPLFERRWVVAVKI